MTSVLESLNQGLTRAMAEDERVVLIGEDVLDPYGGAFKVSRGLSSTFPDRVLTSPISEAGITGVAAGMALRGFHPVVEIMFGDFTTLLADQIINHIAKFRWMYNDQVNVPLVIRTPMGGRRGYGPTHSQSLEKLYLGIPGLRVIAPTHLDDPGELLYHCITQESDPVLFVENKLLYLLPLASENLQADFDVSREGEIAYPCLRYTLRGAPTPQLTITAYGYSAELAREAVLRLAYEKELFCELVVPTQLAPFELEPLLASTRRTGRLLAIEEGTLTAGWGAEVIARTVESLGSGLLCARRLAGADQPVPASGPLEEAAFPSSDDIYRTAQSMVYLR